VSRRSILLPLGGVLAVLAGGCKEKPPVTPPQQRAGSPFRYPEDLWDAGVEGQTLLRVFVTAQGTVDSVRVEKSSGYAGFDSAAVQGAPQLRFEPARQGPEAIAAWVLLPVEFDLPASDSTKGGTP
jgi:protein TonB